MINDLRRFTLLILSVTILSCEVLEDPEANTDMNLPVTGASLSGDWRVTSFQDDGQEGTDEFDGLTFTFAANGDLTISDGQEMTTASWLVNGTGTLMNIILTPDNLRTFPMRPELEDLNDDGWKIVEFNDRTLRIVEDGKENGDAVSFTRAL